MRYDPRDYVHAILSLWSIVTRRAQGYLEHGKATNVKGQVLDRRAGRWERMAKCSSTLMPCHTGSFSSE